VPPQPLQQNSTNQIHSNDAQERTLAIITLDGNLDAITQHIKSYGFSVLNTKAFRLSMDQAKEFYQDYEQDQTYYDKYTTWLSR
jgi:nucleoside diphosphate kinase